MKIICIGRNYRKHARELNSEVPDSPVFFLKPDTALLAEGKDFCLPSFSSDVHHEIELVVRINKPGKNIDERFAAQYYREISLGIDFTARDIQKTCIAKGLPWEIAKAFDGAAALGSLIPLGNADIQNISFRLEINEKTVQSGNSADMIFSVNTVISYVSRFISLQEGDLLYTGTPEGVGPVKRGDHLRAYLQDQLLLDLFVQ